VPEGAPVEAASSILRQRPQRPRPAASLPVVRGVARFARPPRRPLPPLDRVHLVAAPPGLRPQPWARGFRAFRQREARFRESLERARAELESGRPQEAVRRWAAAPDLAEVLRRTEGPAPELWERRPADPDFLELRAGWTDLPSAASYRLADGGTDEQRAEVARTLAPYLVVPCAPLTVRLGDVGVLALSGARDQVVALSRWLAIQLAVLHSPRELRLAAVLTTRTDWAWFAALPHAGGDDGPMLAAGPDDARRLLSGLAALVEERGGETAGPAVVVLVDEELGLPRETLEPLLDRGPSAGVHVVWLARRRSAVPPQAGAVVAVSSPTVAVRWTDTGRAVEEASLDVVPLTPIATAAWNLAGLDDAAEAEPTPAAPSEPSARLLGMGDPTPEEVLRRREQEVGDPLGLSAEIPIGSTVGGYLLKRQLGAGGMGAVYLARHRSLPRDVAVKVLHPGFAGHEQFRDRFERESDLLCRLDHPNVVDVIDRGQDGDLLWMSMRYIPGPDLDTALRERGPFPPEQAVAVVADVARALDAAHDAGLLHRDVKPANVLLRRHSDGTEQAMLTDFGIAKDLAAAVTITGAGEAPATIAYAAPEQLDGLPLDRRADVYSLGAVLFELLTGRRAFPATDVAPLLASVLAGPVPDVRGLRPEVPVALTAVVTRALAKDRDERFETCGDLVAAARQSLARAPTTTVGLPDTPPPPPPPHRAAPS
jgi:serine/threonine-protein kinase